MLNKKDIIESHQRKLVDLTFFVFLQEPPKASNIESYVGTINNLGLHMFISAVINSKRHRQNNIFLLTNESTDKVKELNSRGRQIYTTLVKAIVLVGK